MKLGTATGWLAALLVAGCGGGSGGSASSPGNGSGDGSSGYQAGPGPLGGAVLYSDFRAGKRLMLHQRDAIAVTPTALKERLATMDVNLDAFDGVFLHLPTVGSAVMKPAAVSAQAIADDLKPVYGLAPGRLRFNFATVTMQRDMDAFDNWAPVLSNITNLAKVARDAGLVGIVIDNESIAGLRVNYPYDLKFQTKTLDEYRVQQQLISKQIMQAIVAEFPDAAVVVLRGPAGAETKSPPTLVNLEVDAAQLLGPFFAGFVEGSGARSLIIDGGSDYGLRTAEQFAGSASWRKTMLPSVDTASAFIPAALRATWASTVRVGFGLNEVDGAHGNLLPNDQALWAATVRAAINATDTLAWASFTFTDMTKVAPSDSYGYGWVTAARRGKAAAASPTMHLASTIPGSGSGLMAQYFQQVVNYNGETVGTELAQTSLDATIDFDFNAGPTNTILSQTENYAVIWSGYVEAPASGSYTLVTSTDDGMQVTIGGTVVVDRYFDQGESLAAGIPFTMTAGVRYPMKVRWFQHTGGAGAHIQWVLPNAVMEVIPPSALYPTF